MLMNIIFVVFTLLSLGRVQEIKGDDDKLNKSLSLASGRLNRLVTSFDLNQTNTHFRPQNLVTLESLAGSTAKSFQTTSSVLHLRPSRPRHIASIHNELLDMRLELTSPSNLQREYRLIIVWRLIVHLRNAHHRSHRDRRETNQTNNNTNDNIQIEVPKIKAKVEQETTAIKYLVFLRPYGQVKRKEYSFTDSNNNLDPPVTANETYRFQVPQPVRANVGYEICLRSLNSGPFKQSEEFRKKYPLDATTTNILGQANNPLFVCKEVILEPEHDEMDIEIIDNKLKERGRSLDLDSDPGDVNSVKLDQDTAADAFVLYTAISSGSASVFLLIVLVVFCCCRCNRAKKSYHDSREGIRYDRANTDYLNEH